MTGQGGSASEGWLGRVGRATNLALMEPALWPIALAGFLSRGGFVIFLAAIVPIPTAVGMANAIGPTAVTAAGLTPESMLLLAAVALGLIAWFVLGGIIGAGADIALDDALGGARDRVRATPTGRLVRRLVGIRIVALIPLALASAVSARPIFDALYRQLTAPSDVAAPLAARVVMEAAGPVAVVCVGWFFGELLGGLAVRIAVSADRSIGRALIGAFGHVFRRPFGTLATALLGSVGFLVTVGLSLGAAATASTELRDLVRDTTQPPLVLLATLIIVATWLGALVLAGVAATWRSLLWSAEVGGTPARDVRASE